MGASRSLVPVLTAAILCLGANSSAGAELSSVVGVGNKSCGAWTAARRSQTMLADVYEGWIAGFLTGANSIISNTEHIDTLAEIIAHRDAEGIWAWIDNYCQSYPLDSIATAADKLGAELIRKAANASHR
jgi:hypothetical protein